MRIAILENLHTGDYCGVATIDEFRIYNGAMETPQIAADFRFRSRYFASGLK